MNINLCYLILNIIFLIVLRIFLGNKNISSKYILAILFGYLLLTFISYSYIDVIISSIFKLKYLDVKMYLLLIVLVNGIMLYSINRPVKTRYRIPNYLLYILFMIIFVYSLSIILGNQIQIFYMMDIKNVVNFMDLSFIIFIIYLIIIGFVYIGYSIYEGKVKISKPNINKIFDRFKNKKKMLTPYEILNYEYKDNLVINGVNASIIFEDSNSDNIIKNYYILNHDIHAKLMNGFTLEENEMLKSICMKLGVGRLASVDINNVNLLNIISVDEYNLLKRVVG